MNRYYVCLQAFYQKGKITILGIAVKNRSYIKEVTIG
jgi:hypothetical protein